ncbi:MAG: glycoside hydrolase family 78 protein [Caldilineaceae bacterium]|nr:glycoside hydrolase family 78 protein [Caldilineaceae bacterium]
MIDTNVTITRLRFEQIRQSLGIGVNNPRLSWITETSIPGWTQAAYESEYYDDDKLRASTGKINSDQSVLVAWPFAPLTSAQQVSVRVRVWGKDGSASDWSEPASVETGLLHPIDWTAHFIRPDWDEDTSIPQPSPLLRREFVIDRPVRQARLYVTSLGVYEAYLNGQRVGDHLLDPGWTSYHHRLIYSTFDVGDRLRQGTNALGAILGEGWFCGRLGFGGGRRNLYGDRAALLAQLTVTYEDGSTAHIVSNEEWRAATGPILRSELYDGEAYDARLEKEGWADPSYDESDWAGVRVVDYNKATLVAPSGPPVRRMENLQPVTITTSPSGKTILDFGQNLVGFLRIRAQGEAGQTVTLRHAEVLEEGELSIRPLRHARATDIYTLKGGGVEVWEPRFTFHGFRYAEVTGWPGELKTGDIEAVVCHSDMERTGWFDASDPLINRLHENVVWSMRGNFFSIPTDCPQRDERLGWTGDIQVFAPTASFLYDSAGFLTSWLADLAAEQAVAGVVPFFVPDAAPRPRANPPAAAWGDAAVIVPWVLYQRFGDKGILETQFESMCAWVDKVAEVAGESLLWDTGMQFGDWLDPAAPPDKPGDARTPAFIVATANFARSAELLGRVAQVLGRDDIATHYGTLAQSVREAFQFNYVTPAGRVIADAATAYALAIQFALLANEQQRAEAGRRLAELVRANRYRISTGFVGTPLICDALCSVGAEDVAFRLIMQREVPSWLYPVTMGATTIWERWDSMLPDGSVNPGEMTSFNHYALGAVADWLHRHVAGLAPAAPGYRAVTIRPRPGGGLIHASARLNTPYGLAQSSWRIADGEFHLEVVLPPNTSGEVIWPDGAGGRRESIAAGRHQWTTPYVEVKPAPIAMSLDLSVGELLEDEQAFERVFSILMRHNFELADRLKDRHAMTVRQIVFLMPNADAAIAEIEAAFAELR